MYIHPIRYERPDPIDAGLLEDRENIQKGEQSYQWQDSRVVRNWYHFRYILYYRHLYLDHNGGDPSNKSFCFRYWRLTCILLAVLIASALCPQQ